MKTYEQVVAKATYDGAKSHFLGRCFVDGPHSYVYAAQFIYGVSRDTFILDCYDLWDSVNLKNKSDTDLIIADLLAGICD